MAVYATTAELATYLGLEEAALEPESARLLRLASDLIDYVTLNRVDTENTTMMSRVTDATCAQVEYWLETGDANGIVAQASKMGFGSFSMDGSLSMLGPRTRQILTMVGLTYRGVSQSINRSPLHDTFFDPRGVWR
jgi:hypothetical protein